jgi:hypothetical protein
MLRLMSYVLILMLGGCAGTSPERLAKVNEVLVMVRGDARTTLVMGCDNLPVAEVAFDVVQPFLPPDPQTQAIVLGVNAAGEIAKAICAQVKAAQPL